MGTRENTESRKFTNKAWSHILTWNKTSQTHPRKKRAQIHRQIIRIWHHKGQSQDQEVGVSMIWLKITFKTKTFFFFLPFNAMCFAFFVGVTTCKSAVPCTRLVISRILCEHLHPKKCVKLLKISIGLINEAHCVHSGKFNKTNKICYAVSHFWADVLMQMISWNCTLS